MDLKHSSVVYHLCIDDLGNDILICKLCSVYTPNTYSKVNFMESILQLPCNITLM